ncbi:pre-rRNA processing protein [Cordyceps javanica]|uniref:Pre-rRNA processing protein n=1 Tax=Cordyceps javanica TaxID=43265 RepID=A0A545VN06_9HYPO|nr:pre-rRNA processing protein [Cordyceps javanica]TQW03108.1 pre-rRNA processing protein [Cordyceps javanica]
MAPKNASKRRQEDEDRIAESEPLLSGDSVAADTSYGSQTVTNDAASDAPSSQAPLKPHQSKRRWPSLVAMLLLGSVVIVVIVLGFLVPPAIQTYIEKAVVLEPTGLSLDSISFTGIRARVQGNFRMDPARVEDDTARRIGRIAMRIMRTVAAEQTHIKLYVPGYGDAMVGSAVVPPLDLNLVDGQNTFIDVVTDMKLGDNASIKKIVNDWLTGKISELEVKTATALQLKSGFIPLGTHDIVESMVLEAKDAPSIPEYSIQHLNFHQVPLGHGDSQGIGANVSVSIQNEYPVSLTVPRVGFEVLISGCTPEDPKIVVGTGRSSTIDVKPNTEIIAEASGLISKLPQKLTQACPVSELSPLDEFLKHYLGGEDGQIFVRGKQPSDSELPQWLGDMLESVTVPIDFPGSSFDDLLRNFSLTDVKFSLPSPFEPQGKPRVSGTVVAVAALPEGVDVDLGVESLKSQGNLFYKDKKFGELNLRKWQKASSRKLDSDAKETLIEITSRVDNAPIDITDNDVFSSLASEYIFGSREIIVQARAKLDVKVDTVLGPLVIKDVPAEGKVPVNGLPGDLISNVLPRVGDIWVRNTTSTAVRVECVVNFTNPTPYSASIPYINLHVISEGNILADVTMQDLLVGQGNVTDVTVSASWDPKGFGGDASREAGRRLISKFLSGKNTSVSIRSHRGSLPSLPDLGEALSRINLTLPTPRLELPGDDSKHNNDSLPGFIRDAIFHVLTSSATFVLASPLRRNTVHIEYINATAFYNHTEPIARIEHAQSFDVPPGLSETPRLGVQWSRESVGYDRLREALGGSLRLDALAQVTVRLGRWIETLNYEGRGLGAKVRL